MQFQVPQFEIEGKLIGPFTTIQVLYITVTGIVSFLMFPILTIGLWFLFATTLIGGSLVIALVKIQGRPMIVFLSSAFQYFWGPKILSFKPPIVEVIGLKNIQPNSPLKKFDIPKQTIRPSSLPPEAPHIAQNTSPLPKNIITQPINPDLTYAPEISDDSIPSIPSIVVTGHQPIAPAPIAVTPAGSPAPHFVPQPIIITEPEPMIPPPPLPVYMTKKKSRLQSLFNQITTSSLPIPFREKSFKQDNAKQAEQYELIQKTTGETVVARRVDYR